MYDAILHICRFGSYRRAGTEAGPEKKHTSQAQYVIKYSIGVERASGCIMSNTKKNKKSRSKDDFEERIMNIDTEYEDIPIDKKDPVMVKSQAIQTAHTMAMAGIITSIIPLLGLVLGIMAFLKLKGLGQIPYDLRRRFASSRALAKGAIAASIVMMVIMAILISSGMFR